MNVDGEGVRFDANKPAMEMVPLHLLEDAAKVLDHASKEKYPPWNWARGMAWSRSYASLIRHMAAWYCGEDLDAESGLPHLGHAMCNLLFLTHYTKNFLAGDDRPMEFFKPDVAMQEAAQHYAITKSIYEGADLQKYFYKLVRKYNLIAVDFAQIVGYTQETEAEAKAEAEAEAEAEATEEAAQYYEIAKRVDTEPELDAFFHKLVEKYNLDAYAFAQRIKHKDSASVDAAIRCYRKVENKYSPEKLHAYFDSLVETFELDRVKFAENIKCKTT